MLFRSQKVSLAKESECLATSRTVRDKVIEAIKESIADEVIDKEQARLVFGNILSKMNGMWGSTSFGTYDVTVYADGSEIGTIYGIEAEDEDDAVSMVENDFSVSNITTTFQFSYENEEFEGEISVGSWNHNIDFTFEACESDE